MLWTVMNRSEAEKTTKTSRIYGENRKNTTKRSELHFRFVVP